MTKQDKSNRRATRTSSAKGFTATSAVPGLLRDSRRTPKDQPRTDSLPARDRVTAQLTALARIKAEQEAQWAAERRQAARQSAKWRAGKDRREAAERPEKIALLRQFGDWATRHRLPATRLGSQSRAKGWWIAQKGGEAYGNLDSRHPDCMPIIKVGAYKGMRECECGQINDFSIEEIVGAIVQIVRKSGCPWD
jgi:hypothetical protein